MALADLKRIAEQKFVGRSIIDSATDDDAGKQLLAMKIRDHGANSELREDQLDEFFAKSLALFGGADKPPAIVRKILDPHNHKIDFRKTTKDNDIMAKRPWCDDNVNHCDASNQGCD